jgi:hypothetical protein
MAIAAGHVSKKSTDCQNLFKCGNRVKNVLKQIANIWADLEIVTVTLQDPEFLTKLALFNAVTEDCNYLWSILARRQV